jgi:RNase adapter protein RapZ
MSAAGQTEQRLRVVLVTGMSGAGKGSVLRALEDIGYEAVDNPPLPMLEEMVARSERRLAIGVDARTRGFDAGAVLDALRRLRANPGLRPELVFVWADEATLLRRYTETRRRHPLAPQGRVVDGIAAEQGLTAPLRDAADLAIDTSGLPLPALRQRIEQFFGAAGDGGSRRMMVSLVSFAYAQGLPREADLVFDSRFLRNPHYDPILRDKTGLESDVGAFIAADPDYPQFFRTLTELIGLLLPRFVQEGKKYTTITIGCTGGKHRSVYLVEQLARFLESRVAGETAAGRNGVEWQLNVTHRELARPGHPAELTNNRSIPRPDGKSSGEAARPLPVQAQEA